MSELVDIYNEDKHPTGISMPREGLFLSQGQYMLYVLAIIENAEGKILITRRALDKHWAAGWWEVTGGGVLAGETSLDALVREVREETGLDVAGLQLEPIYSYKNVDLKRGDNYIVDIYRIRLDFDIADVTLQASEAIDCALASWNEIEALNEQGIFLHFERLRQAVEHA